MSGEEIDVNDWLIEAAGEDDIERARNYTNFFEETFFNSSKPLHLAAQGTFFNVCKFLIEKRRVEVNEPNSRGKTPLYYACWSYSNNEEEAAKIMELLLNNGANISISGLSSETSLLHHAAKVGWKDAVNVLLKAGSDVNIRSKNGSTPLHIASRFGHEDIVEILCQHGAKVNARNENGWSPLHEVALTSLSKSAEIIKTLLKFGANINAQGAYMETALHCAWPTRLDIASVLLDNGCDVNIETSRGKVALDTMIVRATNSDTAIGEKGMLSVLRGMYDDDGIDADDIRWSVCWSLQTLDEHLVKLKTAKLFVNQKNLRHLENDDFFDFEEKCKEEISAAKNEELHLGITLFDILSVGVNPFYAKNKPLMEALDFFHWDSFPLYKSIILNNVKKSKLRLDLLEAGEKWLSILLKTSSVLNEFSVSAEIMSVEILSLIISFLSNEELEALITCGEELHRQLIRNSSDI